MGTNALFGSPGGIAADQAGNLYVIDLNAIRKISPNLTVNTIAGFASFGGYSDASTNALFQDPLDLAVDKDGYIYVADWGNCAVRKISPLGVVTTLAGNGTYGYINATGTNAEFSNIYGIAVDSSGNVYVSDVSFLPPYTSQLCLIRKITPDGIVSTLAGGSQGYNDGVGPGAQFYSPQGLAVDVGGTVYVADGFGIRKVSPDGTVTTWVGSQNNNGTELDGIGANAGFYGARGIALNRSGGAYVADENGKTIRFVSSAGVVSTVAGLADQAPTTNFNDGVGSDARFKSPYGIAVGTAGNVFITDKFANTVLGGVPPSLPAIGGFTESAGITPIRSNNPWLFTAHFTNIVSDLRLRVESTTTTNVEGSWTDLPDAEQWADTDGNWTLHTTDVPTGTQYFRVVASAPGYFDSASAAVGPETVLAGIAQFGVFNVQPPTPYRSGVSWKFSIVETSVISGLSLRVQYTADGTNWNNLSDGQMSTSDSVNWKVTSFAVPTGTLSFRVVASASTYPDRISGQLGPFTIVAGLSDVDPFLVADGGTPVRSSNPWQFLAFDADPVPGLQLRVQSTTTTNDDGSWQNLPGIHYMTNNAPGWTLDKTDVPTGVQYFRVVASAPGYVDGVSTTVGPQTVLPGFDLWGYFSYETTVPFSTATPWAFVIDQPSQIPGMSLHVKFSRTPDDPNSWTYLPGGGQMTRQDAVNWGLLTTNLPIGTNVSFRVVASAPDYVDLDSAALGPFDIERPFPVRTTTDSTGKTRTLEDVGQVMSFFHAVGGAVVNIVVVGATTVIQGAVTLAADVGSSVKMIINKGQVVKVAGVDVQANATVVVSGTINGPVSVGIVSQGAGNIVSQGAGNIVSQGAGNFAENAKTVELAAQLLQTYLISQDGGGIVSQGAGNLGAPHIVSQKAGKNGPIQPADLTQPTFTGQMTINGDYSQFPGTALIIGIAGTNTLDEGAQQFDQLVVNGRVNFVGGAIVFALLDPDDQTNLANAFQPPDGATFDVVVASNIVVGAVHILGPVWADGLFFKGGVVTRDDGLQALRLMATHIPPQISIQNAGSALQLIYLTNYTGYAVESSPDLVNWSTFSTGTNVVELSPTNSSQFFRLSKP